MLGTAQDTNDSEIVTDPSVFSLDYFRQKVVEFQTVLNGVDSVSAALTVVLDNAVSDEVSQQTLDFMDEIDGKKTQLRLMAESINAASAAVNALGGRAPVLSIPGTLGFAPLVIPAGTIALIAAAVTLMLWGRDLFARVADYYSRQQIIDAQPTPEARGAVAAAAGVADNTLKVSDQSIVSVAGNAIKWAAIGLLAWLAWKQFGGAGSSRRRR